MPPYTSPGARRPKISKSTTDKQELIDKQQEMIDLYRETTQDRDDIINHLKRLVNLQEIQIDELKSDLKAMRLKMESYAQSVQHYKEKLSEYEKEQ